MADNYTSSCLIKPIPAMCAAAIGSASTGASVLVESGNVSYVYDVNYAIGRLQTHIPGYNPAYTTISAYGFTSDTVSRTWSAYVYTNVSSGLFPGSGGVTPTSGGVCATDSYDVTDPSYTVVAWTSLLTSGGWIGGGGYYNGTSSSYIPGGCNSGRCSVGYCSGGSWTYVAPGAGITSPPSVVNTILGLAAAPAAMPSPCGGGSSGGGDCDIFIGVVRTAPTGGFGAGTVVSAVFNTDGSYSTSGGAIAVVFPYIS